MASAKYISIVEKLKREILSGRYEEGAEFPSGGRLAARFGVSRPTINRVMIDLRNEGLVSTSPGCIPRLTRFAQHATGALGIIHPGFRYGDVLSKICNALVRNGERQGWDIIVVEMIEKTPEKRFKELMRAIHRFSEERVAGLFLQPFEYPGEKKAPLRRFWNELARCDMPVVLLDFNPQPDGGNALYDLVCMDNFSAGMSLGRSLFSRGVKRPAFLLRNGSPPSDMDRMHGVACAAVESGFGWAKEKNVLACGPEDRTAVAKFIREFRPDAIVCGNDMTAVELHSTVSDLGLLRGLRLAGFDNQPKAESLGITSVVQPCEEIAAIALQTLTARLRNPSLPVHTVLVPDRGVVR